MKRFLAVSVYSGHNKKVLAIRDFDVPMMEGEEGNYASSQPCHILVLWVEELP